MKPFRYARGEFGYAAVWREVAVALMDAARNYGYAQLPVDVLIQSADNILADVARKFRGGSPEAFAFRLARLALLLNPLARAALIRAAEDA
jgi:hypothetical protein